MKQEEKSQLARKKILESAAVLFTQKGYENTTLQDIMDHCGFSKGAIYHYFRAKEDMMDALNEEMFLENNPFDAVRKRSDLTGLEKMKLAITLNQSDQERMVLSQQTIPILKNPRILAGMIESNRRLLTPFWLELIEEGIKDGSVQTAYARELSELIPLLEFWMMPSVYPADTAQLENKVRFISEMLDKMGLPLLDQDIVDMFHSVFAENGGTSTCRT